MYDDNKPKTGFWKGFLAGFSFFLIIMLVISGVFFGIAVLFRNHIDTDYLLGRIGLMRAEKAEELIEAAAEAAKKDPGEDLSEYAARYQEVMDYIDYYMVLDYDKDAMTVDALRALVDGMKDPYSAYLTAEEMAEMMESSSGEYCGIGVSVQQQTDTLEIRVVQVFKGGGAEEAGLMKDDRIIGVDGTDITGEALDDVVSLIRGEEGSFVTVTVYRELTGETLDFTVQRRIVEVETVNSRMLSDHVGYIGLTEFDEVSPGQVRAAIEELEKQGMEKLVFDLRDNPGGLLDSVLAICDLFLPKKELIFYMEDKQGQVYKYYTEEAALFEGELTVLVNGNSASASEVFTGCMKDKERGVILGEQTFGKGIVQSFYYLSDGSAIKLTTEHYCTPAGHDIHGIGIEPDIKGADDPETEQDELLEMAEEMLK